MSEVNNIGLLQYINCKQKERKEINEKDDSLIKDFNTANNLYNAIILINYFVTDLFDSTLDLKALKKDSNGENFNIIKQAFISNTIIEIKDIIKSSIIFEYNLYIKEIENISFNDFLLINTNEKEWINYYFIKYPALQEVIKRRVDNSIAFYVQFQKHFKKDIGRLQDLFSIKDTELINIELQKGDSHNNGQSVILLKFKTKDIYYKPRKLDNEEFIFSFVGKLNALGLSKSLEIPRSISGVDRGWMEGVRYEDTSNPCRFYENQGINLCIFYFINGKDLISDNIIVSKEFPNYFDLECIFQSTLNFNEQTPYEMSTDAYEFLTTSVLSSNLLPEDSFYTENYQGISISGLSYVNGAIPLYTFENKGSKINRILKNVQIKNKNHHLPQHEISVVEKTENIIKGFKYAYDFFINNKHEISKEIREVLEDKKLKTRILYRPTQIYSKIIDESYLPQYLNSNKKREELFNSLYNAESNFFNNTNIIKSEIKQLKNGDIPTFYSFHNSKSLYNNSGESINHMFFNKTGLDLTMYKLSLCSQADLNRQIELIELSFAIFEGYNKQGKAIVKGTDYKIKDKFENEYINSSENNIEKSITLILKKIKNKTLRKNYFIDSYIDLVQTPRSTWSITSIPFGLFDGIDGYAFFFLNYFLLYQDSNILRKGTDFLNQGLKQFKEHISYYKNVSGFNKVSLMNYPISTFYVAEYYMEKGVHIEELNSHSIELILDWIEGFYIFDNDFDIMGGGAGTILYLLKLYKRTSDKRVLNIAFKIANHLILNSKSTDNDTTCWVSSYGKAHTGFSHGSSGIAFALASLSNVSDDDKKRNSFVKHVVKALNFERNLYDREKRYWYFFKNFNNEKVDKLPNHFWAYGSGAIAQSRILLKNIYTDTLLNKELDIAIENLKRNGFLGNLNYSSGAIGNVDMLNSYANLKNDKNLYQNIMVYFDEIYSEMANSNNSILACSPVGINGNSIFWEMNGLFTGLVGIGNTCLNILDYDKTVKLFN